MKKAIILVLFFNSCMATSEDLYKKINLPSKPDIGYNRINFFNPYISFRNTDIYYYFGFKRTLIEEKLLSRNIWVPKNHNFRFLYPKFNIELLVINQFEIPQSFTWKERLILSDALELLTFAINSDIFKQEMMKSDFFDNDHQKTISSESIINDIKEANFKIILGKNKLPSEVVAEASVGGYSHTIWFRDDIDYTKQSITYLAMVLGHELTHNMGYSHLSGVPYGVHIPILKAIAYASEKEVQEFINTTPYYEDDFLYQVRDIKTLPVINYNKNNKPVDKIMDFESDFINLSFPIK